MNYFDGLEFVCSGNNQDYRIRFEDREFSDYYGIQYNHSGICRLRIDGGDRMDLDGGSVFFTAPGRRYSYGAPSGSSRHHAYICFRGERVKSFIDGGLFSPYAGLPVFKIGNTEKFFRNLFDLCNILCRPAGSREARAVHLLEGLLLQIAEEPRNSGVNPYLQKCIDVLRRKIVEDPQSEWDFENEARKMSISYPHFRRLFRQVTEFSPTHFLIECRLNLAAGMLTDSNLPINEIARRCGYRDEFYFYRLFRKYRFCTAAAYRKKFGP